MPVPSALRLALSALAGAGSAAVLLSVVEGSSSRAFGIAVPSHWVLAGVALVLSAGAAWVLLPGGGESTAELSGDHPVCQACGGSVRADWRLCPHCGALLTDEAEPSTDNVQMMRS